LGEQKQRINLYCILFVVFGVVSFISNAIQSGMFGISGENLTRRLRSEGFKKMLSQEIGWFDDKDNGVGVLSTKLAIEAAAVQGVSPLKNLLE
jgi:ABC-type multidrug transport system fused ATPase/permease subunit